MAVLSVNRKYSGFLGGTLIIIVLARAHGSGVAAAAPVPNAAHAQQLLAHGMRMADLFDWDDAALDLQSAEQEFTLLGDKRNALYARIASVRATITKRNLLRTSAQLGSYLESNSSVRSDAQLRLLCLITKADIDQEFDTRLGGREWEQVRALAESVGDARWQNRALGFIGVSAFYDGDFETAAKDAGTALSVATNTGDLGAEIRFTTVLGMGLEEGRKYEQALPYFDKALAMTRAIPDMGYPLLTNLAKLQAFIGLQHYDAAEQLAEEMLKQISLKHQTYALARLLPYAAQLAIVRGNVQEAVSDLKQSIAICQAEGYMQMEAQPEEMLSEILRRQGHLVKAEYYAGQAAASSQSAGDKWSLPERLRTLAELQVAQGKYVNADRTYNKASAFVEAALAGSSSAFEKTSLIKASGPLYPEYFALLASHLNNSKQAYSVVEQVRGRVTADLLESGARNSASARDIEGRISALQLQMMSATAVTDISRFRDQIFTVEQARWITPDVSILKNRARTVIPIETLIQSLNASTGILEYVVAEPRSYCLVLSHEGVHIVTLPGEADLDGLTAAYLKAVRDRSPAQAEARELFEALLRPISEYEHKANLVIVPDGQLHLLPFDALEDSSGAYVMQSHVVVYAPSATTYYLLNKEAKGTNQSMVPFLGVGGIQYSQSALRTESLERGGPNQKLGDLPFSKKEVLDASSTLRGKDRLLLASDATESAFKHAVEENFATIHLAVHGYADNPDPDDAWLALLPDRAAGEDGLLHASEIAMMRINARLVVLSSCDTAVGPLQGEEGISTLSSAFLLAGARAVVSTLWSVDDASSLFLMDEFYRRIGSGTSPELALVEAKREMLRKFGGSAIPYFWASYTFEGASGRPIYR